MKKTLSLLSIIILIAAASSLLAQEDVQSQTRRQAQNTVRDANGDGICDDCGRETGSGRLNAPGKKIQNGKHYGPGDGTGNQGNRPQNGTGYGVQSGKRSGAQNGTGTRMGRQGKRGNGRSGQPGRGGRR